MILFLTRSFLDIVAKNQKQVFFNLKSPSSVYNLNGAQNFKFIGFIYATLIGWILYTFHDTSSLDIMKKRGLSINLNIRHSKVFSSDKKLKILAVIPYYILIIQSFWQYRCNRTHHILNGVAFKYIYSPLRTFEENPLQFCFNI